MIEIKWIKLAVNMFDDEKIKLIRTMPEANAIVVIWVQLLCLAGKNNHGGYVYMDQNVAYSEEMLASLFDHPLNTIRMALSTLEKFGLIEINSDKTIDVINWEKHQNFEGLEKIREQNRIRQQKYRERKRQKRLDNSNVTSRDSNAPEEEEDKRVDTEEDKGVDKEQYQSVVIEDDINKAVEFYKSNFGKLGDYIKTDLNEWVSDIGIDLVLEAMKRSVKGQKNYNYATGMAACTAKECGISPEDVIVYSTGVIGAQFDVTKVENNIKTLKDVENQDSHFGKRKYNNNNSRNEKLPEWANDDSNMSDEDEQVEPEKQEAIAARLQKLKEARELKNGAGQNVF